MSDQNQLLAGVNPAFYFPLKNGRYEVTPGLFRFPHDFGNGLQDQKVFQFDLEFSRYRDEKLAARHEKLHKYYCLNNHAPQVSAVINRYILRNLAQEYPDYFQLKHSKSEITLDCRLTQETLRFDTNYQLVESTTRYPVSPEYVDGFDALACQIQEDLSVIKIATTDRDEVTALHLCLPNHWAAEEKIGQSFITVHSAVPGMDKMYQKTGQLMHTLLHKGPFVRFAWGLATDTYLNHHPEPAANRNRPDWHGRRFDPHKPELYMRIERQTLHGLPDIESVLFTIRTYFLDVRELKSDTLKVNNIVSALTNMSPASQHYKGIATDRQAILGWLNDINLPFSY